MSLFKRPQRERQAREDKLMKDARLAAATQHAERELDTVRAAMIAELERIKSILSQDQRKG